MMDPEQLHDHASHIILHAWIATYLGAGHAGGPDFSAAQAGAQIDVTTFSTQLQTQANKLRDSAISLQTALEKMRLANQKLALRMAEHRAFFAKYKTSDNA